MEVTKINWKKHFDAVYCLSLADNIEKRAVMTKEFKRIGIPTSLIHWKITVRNNFYKYIWNNPTFPTKRWWLTVEGALNCTMGHYEIMKECLVMGYESVLIVEDDVRFLKDLKTLKGIIENIPVNDILLLDKSIPLSKEAYKEAVKKSSSKLFMDYSDVKLWGTGCLSLSSRAMKVMTGSLEQMWEPIDNKTNRVNNNGVVVNEDGLVRVASITNACVQDMSLKPETGQYDDIIYEDIADLKKYNL